MREHVGITLWPFCWSLLSQASLKLPPQDTCWAETLVMQFVMQLGRLEAGFPDMSVSCVAAKVAQNLEFRTLATCGESPKVDLLSSGSGVRVPPGVPQLQTLVVGVKVQT